MPEDYGIKVSNDGFDVFSTDDINLSLKTDFTLLKVKASGTVDLTAGLVTIAHNLGYIPQFLAYGVMDEGGFEPGGILFAATNYSLFEFAGVLAGADDTNLYVGGDPFIDSALYFIFYEGVE